MLFYIVALLHTRVSTLIVRCEDDILAAYYNHDGTVPLGSPWRCQQSSKPGERPQARAFLRT